MTCSLQNYVLLIFPMQIIKLGIFDGLKLVTATFPTLSFSKAWFMYPLTGTNPCP